MTRKYHISLETGRPNICKAEIGKCPINNNIEEYPHFDTKEEAKQYIEKTSTPLVMESYKRKIKCKKEEKINYSQEIAELVSHDDKDVNFRAKHMSHFRMRANNLVPLGKKRLRKEDTDEYTQFVAIFGGYNREVSQSLEDSGTVDFFTKGACSVLAYELHKKTNAPLVLMYTGGTEKTNTWFGHAMVKIDKDKYLDIEGTFSRQIMENSYNATHYKEVTPEEFENITGAKSAIDEAHDFDKDYLRIITQKLINRTAEEENLDNKR